MVSGERFEANVRAGESDGLHEDKGKGETGNSKGAETLSVLPGRRSSRHGCNADAGDAGRV